MTRYEELNNIFEDIDTNEKKLIEPLINEVIYLEEQMKYLKTLPFINVNPKNLTQQKTTPASKQYKEFSQSYMNAIRILCSIIHKTDTSAQDELMKKLSEF